MLISLVIMIMFTSYPRPHPAVNYYEGTDCWCVLVLGGEYKWGLDPSIKLWCNNSKKKDIISSIYWHLLTPRGCTRLWTIVYVGRTVLRVYYLICVPFIIVICNKRYYQQSVLWYSWYEWMRGGIKYGGVARSSDEYTLLILRISNIEMLVEGVASSMATHKCNNAIWRGFVRDRRFDSGGELVA